MKHESSGSSLGECRACIPVVAVEVTSVAGSDSLCDREEDEEPESQGNQSMEESVGPDHSDSSGDYHGAFGATAAISLHTMCAAAIADRSPPHDSPPAAAALGCWEALPSGSSHLDFALSDGAQDPVPADSPPHSSDGAVPPQPDESDPADAGAEFAGQGSDARGAFGEAAALADADETTQGQEDAYMWWRWPDS
jgi:hypothetical protein